MAEVEYTAEELEREEWRVVPDTGGAYEISDLGRVRRALPGHCTYVGRILAPAPESNGYPTVCVYYESRGKRQVVTVHKLVALAFIGPRPPGYDVDHIDGVKSNARLSNLEYVTEQENAQRASRLGLLPAGDAHWARRIPERAARGDRNGSRRHPERLTRGERHHFRIHPEKVKRGEDVSSAKMTPDGVRLLRSLHQSGAPAKILMVRFGLSKAQVHKIIHRQSWAHID